MTTPGELGVILKLADVLCNEMLDPEPKEALRLARVAIKHLGERREQRKRSGLDYEYCYNEVCGNSDQCSYHEALNQGIDRARDAITAQAAAHGEEIAKLKDELAASEEVFTEIAGRKKEMEEYTMSLHRSISVLMEQNRELREHAAAHAEDVRKSQVRMVRLEEHIRNHRCSFSVPWCSTHGTYHGDSCALLAEADGKS